MKKIKVHIRKVGTPKTGETVVCKIQVNTDGSRILVYSKDEKVFFEIPATMCPQNLRHMKPLSKEYWEVRGDLLDRAPITRFVRKVKDQNW